MIMELPNHIGVIVDGNRRWAKAQGLPAMEGHRQGYRRVQQMARWLFKRQVAWVTFYLFSTENWQRHPTEVKYLFKLFENSIKTETSKLVKDGIRLLFVGDRLALPTPLPKLMAAAEQATKAGRKGNLVAAINYGGRQAIVEGVKQLARQGQDLRQLTAEQLKASLTSRELPDLDLVIRTSGEQRLSNFLLWESAYAELYFSPKYFPEFDEADLESVLDWYSRRQRRFGGD